MSALNDILNAPVSSANTRGPATVADERKRQIEVNVSFGPALSNTLVASSEKLATHQMQPHSCCLKGRTPSLDYPQSFLAQLISKCVSVTRWM